MKLSIIISYYKALQGLKLILDALQNQSVQNFEVIVSEDDFNLETNLFIEQNKNSYHFSIQHLNQNKDVGFRKNQMLNKSIKSAKSDFLVFIDGDCLPHKHFVKSYLKNIKEDYIFCGRRVMLSEKITKNILSSKNFKEIGLLNLIFSKSKKVKEAIYFPFFQLLLSTKNKGILGCNWGVKKSHLLNINGFDEDYIFPGVGEDTDVEWRLKGKALKLKFLKNKAIVYHLFHKKTRSEERIQDSIKMMNSKKEQNLFVCKNGLIKK